MMIRYMILESGLGTNVAVPSQLNLIFEFGELRISTDQRNQFVLLGIPVGDSCIQASCPKPFCFITMCRYHDTNNNTLKPGGFQGDLSRVPHLLCHLTNVAIEF